MTTINSEQLVTVAGGVTMDQDGRTCTDPRPFPRPFPNPSPFPRPNPFPFPGGPGPTFPGPRNPILR
jgi:hypothetical protein